MQQKIIMLLSLFLFCGKIFGADVSIEKLKNKGATLEEAYENLKFLFTPKQQQFIDKQFKELEESKQLIITFFYFTSSHLGSAGIKDFTGAIKKLQEKYNVEGIITLRGFTKKSKSFYEFTHESYRENDPFRLKIHPPAFKALKIDRVPAYAVSFCNKREFFRFKNCKNLFVAKGNVKLEVFLNEVSKKDKRFKALYETLINPN